jgi:peptide/nickel transport system permease protein
MAMAEASLANGVPRTKRQSVILTFFRQQPIGAFSALLVAALAVASAGADLIAPYDPLAIDFGALLQAPSQEHWFGTDNFGRDLFSRVLYGARTALTIGILASMLGCITGGVIGVTSGYIGYFGGRVDFIIQRLIDMLLSFPIIVLAIVSVYMLGKFRALGIDVNLVVGIAIPIIPKVARVVRAPTLTVREMPYIDAARAAGYGHMRIIFRHIVPNVFAPFIILFAAYVAQAILLEASLSFLGLGVMSQRRPGG